LFTASATVWTAATDSITLKSHQRKIVNYRYTKHLDSTIFYFKLALPIATEANDSIVLFWLHKNLGDAFEHHHYLDSTLHYYKICEQLIPRKNYSLKSFLLGDKAYTYQLLYDYDKSTELSLQALDAAYLAGDSTAVVSSMLNVANDFAFLKMNQEANLYYLKATGTAARTANKKLIEYSLRGYGKYLLETAQWQKGYEFLRKSELLATTNRDSISMAFNWFHLSSYFWEIKQLDSCFYYGTKAEKVWEDRLETIDLSHVCYHLGNCYLKLGQTKKAIHYLTSRTSCVRRQLF
jgi:hypothetical protein